MDSLNHRSKDEIMDAAEVAKKNKIEATADQIERKMEDDRNGVEMEKVSVDETEDDEEVKSGNEGAAVKHTKKVTVYFVSKGRGVSGFTQERAGVKGNSDSADVDPFLTKIESWEPPASLMPMDGESVG